jgi:superfamily II DNA or RNA helicase
MDGNTSREDRAAIFARFKSGVTRVICNVGVLTTGVNLDVRCIIDAKPTKSRRLFVQTIGRGLRTAEGKDHLVILDHAGNHLRLGMVTDIGQDYLDNGKERVASARSRDSRVPLPKLCNECKAVLKHGAAGECPRRGTPIFTITQVQAAVGELVELGAIRTGKRSPALEEQAAFHGELKWIARERSYSHGWVAHKFKERFGVWPNDVRYAEARAPTLATRNWVRSRAIAYARRSAANV